MANYCFGTWNIGTLKGKSGEVCKVLCRRKVKVCCIQEIRWKGEGSRALQIVKLVSCYAPQAGRSQIEKEEFWRQVEGVIMNTDINQEVIVGGDMNGHVG